MSYSAIVGTISGVLQFVVACCALRVSLRFKVSRVGWLFFGAFTLLAVVHVLVSVHPFGIQIELSPAINVLYEIISVLLLGTIMQVELLLWQQGRQRQAEQQARETEEAKAKEQIAQLTRAQDELKQASTRLQTEAEQQKQACEEKLAQMEKASQEQAAAAKQADETARGTIAKLEAEAEVQKQNLEQLQAHVQQMTAQQAELQGQIEAQTQAVRVYEDQLLAGRQTEESLRMMVSKLEADAAQFQQTLEQLDRSHQEQLAALRQSEDEWRNLANRLQAEVREQLAAAPVLEQAQAQPARDQVQEPLPTEPEPEPAAAPGNNHFDPLLLFRQSGIAEVATMTQTRVAYLARVARSLLDHSKDLARFMTRTPQGKQLPRSLALLVDYLADEQFLLLKRIESVRKKFEAARQDNLIPAVAAPAPLPAEPPVPAAAEPAVPSLPEGAIILKADEWIEPAGPGVSSDTEEATTPDFRDLLLSSLTETGTEPAVPDGPVPNPPESAEEPSLDSGTPRL